MNIYYLTVSVCQEPGYTSTGCLSLKVSHEATVTFGIVITSEGSLGEDLHLSSLVGIGRIQLLTGHPADGIISSLTIGLRLPSVPCYVRLSLGQLTA